MTDKPQITASPWTVCCASHGEHLRAQWPRGFAIVGVRFISEMLTNDAFLAVTKGEVARIDGVLAKRPMCYWLERDFMREVWIETELFTVGACDLCSRPQSWVAPYTIRYDHGDETLTVCIDCALDAGEREHEAFPRGRDQKAARKERGAR